MFRLTFLSDASERREDNYLPLRHLAAMLVIYGHSYALTGHADDDADLLARLLPGFYAGSLAVYMFFSISGFLVTLSLLRNPGVLRYLRNRVLRVYPGYVACLLICTLLIGAAFTTLPIGHYLGSEGTWNYLGSNLRPITLTWHLPGVFESNPVAKVVNGTLWSLGLEVRWYAYLGLLAALTLVHRRPVFTIVASSLLIFGVWEWWSGKPDTNDYRALSQTFLLAALCAHWRKRIPVSHGLMAGFVVTMAVTNGSRWFTPAVVLAASYFTFWVAYALPTLRWPRNCDYSYGLFLYGFPVQQALIAMLPQIAPLTLFPAATAVALAFAIPSWHLIERPALQWKFRRSESVLATA